MTTIIVQHTRIYSLNLINGKQIKINLDKKCIVNDVEYDNNWIRFENVFIENDIIENDIIESIKIIKFNYLYLVVKDIVTNEKVYYHNKQNTKHYLINGHIIYYENAHMISFTNEHLEKIILLCDRKHTYV